MIVVSKGRPELLHDHRRLYGQPTSGPDGGTVGRVPSQGPGCHRPRLGTFAGAMPDPGQARYGRLGTTRRERDPAGHHRVLACGLPPSVVRRSLPQAAVSALRWAGAAAGTYG